LNISKKSYRVTRNDTASTKLVYFEAYEAAHTALQRA
jgi:hypothetical protein